MMNDAPMTGMEYGTLDPGCPEELVKCLEKCHDQMTIKELQSVAEYCNNKVNKMRDALENEVTIEDFEKAKKEDIDQDNEEGEME